MPLSRLCRRVRSETLHDKRAVATSNLFALSSALPSAEPLHDDRDLFPEVRVGLEIRQCGMGLRGIGTFECAQQEQTARPVATISRERDDLADDLVVCGSGNGGGEPASHALVALLDVEGGERAPASSLGLGDGDVAPSGGGQVHNG